MDWKSLAGTLIKVGAPAIGTALGGPLGGVIGGTAGKLIADAFGVENTPEAVDTAIKNDPDAAAKLADADAKWNALAEEAKANAADRTAQSQAINAQMGNELGKVSWWHWRHLLGYVPVALGLELVALLPLVVFAKITPELMVAAMGAIMPPLTVFSGLLGYVAQDTTRQKTVAATGEAQPNIVGNLFNTFRKVTGKGKLIAEPVGSRP